MPIRGFILQPTYRIEGGRTVVHLFGRLESGETFLVRDDRDVPHFYIEEHDVDRARELGAERIFASGMRTLEGMPTARVELRIPAETPPLRDRLTAAGIRCHEADVQFARRFLIARGLRGSISIDGPSRPGPGIDRVFENPRLAPADWAPDLQVLSFDIETDRRARRLLSIALAGCGASEVLLFCPQDLEAPPGSVPFKTERDLLAAFCERVRELDPDVLTGWNVVDFDLKVLDRLAQRFRLPFHLARGPGDVRLRPTHARARGSFEAIVPGRVVLDGIALLQGAFVRMEEYSLDFVAREVLGEGKTMTGHDRAEEIVDAFLHDRARFVEYNQVDAQLVLDVLAKLGLVALAVERSRLTGLPIDRVQGAIASFDFLYMMELHRRGFVAPSVGPARGGEANLGGHVFEPEVGLYRDVLVFDFKSLYPSIIRTFQIDPLGFVENPPDGADVIAAPNGAAFRRGRGILPRLVADLMPRREAAKAAGNEVASFAIKILMNSFYGVLGTPACRFHRSEIAGAITSFGREFLRWSKARIEGYGYRVLYGDTDSLFVLSGEDSAEAALALAPEIAARLNADLAVHVEATWGLESQMELEFEKLYLRLLLPAMRHGGGGARKRYAGLVAHDGAEKVVFTGMESVRRDWTELAKRVQRELYERLFADRPVADYLEGVVAELRAGELDDLLIYRKGLRKALDDYTATTPPHVAAARKLPGPPGRIVSYVITTDGPEPVEALRHPPDHEHYVDKQIRPVAEPVLEILHLDFDKAIGDDAQMELF